MKLICDCGTQVMDSPLADVFLVRSTFIFEFCKGCGRHFYGSLMWGDVKGEVERSEETQKRLGRRGNPK